MVWIVGQVVMDTYENFVCILTAISSELTSKIVKFWKQGDRYCQLPVNVCNAIYQRVLRPTCMTFYYPFLLCILNLIIDTEYWFRLISNWYEIRLLKSGQVSSSRGMDRIALSPHINLLPFHQVCWFDYCDWTSLYSFSLSSIQILFDHIAYPCIYIFNHSSQVIKL